LNGFGYADILQISTKNSYLKNALGKPGLTCTKDFADGNAELNCPINKAPHFILWK
jgi:hypothetical protein